MLLVRCLDGTGHSVLLLGDRSNTTLFEGSCQMKVLVIEDKEMHQQSAIETLAGHDLVLVKTFDEAMKIMGEEIDFEAVLTDMMMPMSEQTLAPGVFNPSEQVPYGFVVALKAASQGAKYVAVVTDTNHHHSPISAALDHIGRAYFHLKWEAQQIFDICGAKVIFAHAPFVTDIIKDAPCTMCEGSGKCPACQWRGTKCPCQETEKPGVCSRCQGTLKADKEVEERKDWGRVLNFLITGADQDD